MRHVHHGARSADTSCAGAALALQPGDASLLANLHAYVQINASVLPAAATERLGLKRVVPIAVDRAIVEIINPVVERSVTIACMTTHELIIKVRGAHW